MAQAFPNSTFVGSDYHAASIDTARSRATEAGVRNVRFEVAPRRSSAAPRRDRLRAGDHVRLPARHGRSVGAARRVRDVIADDGTWMVVEPMAGDHVEDNLIRSAARTTGSRRCCARRRRCRRTSGWRSARRPVRRASATSPQRRASRGSAVWPRPRSTGCSKSAPDTDGSQEHTGVMATMSGQRRTWVRRSAGPGGRCSSPRRSASATRVATSRSRRSCAGSSPTCRSTGSRSIPSRASSRMPESRSPASAWLANESAHIEDESADHDLHVFQGFAGWTRSW